MTSRNKNLLTFSIIPQIIVVKILASFPETVEHLYSTTLYPIISKIPRFLLGWIPFSVGDILYTLATVFIVRFLIRKGHYLFKKPGLFFKEILLAVSILYALFHLLWGLNYYRLPLHEKLQLDDEYTNEELYHFTEALILKSNALHHQLATDSSALVEIPYSKAEIYRMSFDGYKNLADEFPELQPLPKSIKTSLYSTALSYMGYSGYLNPFTNEAQVNGLQIDFRYPVVSCHEEAHQIGYSAENEANFIGYLAATNNSDPYFQYSGYLYVLRYCLGEVKKRDPDKFNEFEQLLRPGIIKNYIEVATFWRRYKTKAEPFFKRTFHSFLKANNQKKGIKSYSYVVALLINYHKNKKL